MAYLVLLMPWGGGGVAGVLMPWGAMLCTRCESGWGWGGGGRGVGRGGGGQLPARIGGGPRCEFGGIWVGGNAVHTLLPNGEQVDGPTGL